MNSTVAPTIEDRWARLRHATLIACVADAPDVLRRAYGALDRGVILPQNFGEQTVFVELATGPGYLMSEATWRRLLELALVESN